MRAALALTASIAYAVDIDSVTSDKESNATGFTQDNCLK